jgi:hypothetical protein
MLHAFLYGGSLSDFTRLESSTKSSGKILIWYWLDIDWYWFDIDIDIDIDIDWYWLILIWYWLDVDWYPLSFLMSFLNIPQCFQIPENS